MRGMNTHWFHVALAVVLNILAAVTFAFAVISSRAVP